VSVSMATEISPRSTIRTLPVNPLLHQTNIMPTETSQVVSKGVENVHHKSLSRFDPLLSGSSTLATPPRQCLVGGSALNVTLPPPQGSSPTRSIFRRANSGSFQQESTFSPQGHRRSSTGVMNSSGAFEAVQPGTTDLAANMSELVKALGSTSLASPIQTPEARRGSRNIFKPNHRRSSTGGLPPFNIQQEGSQSETMDLAGNMSELVETLGSTSLTPSVQTPKSKKGRKPDLMRSSTAPTLSIPLVDNASNIPVTSQGSVTGPPGHRKSKSGANICDELKADGIVRSISPQESSNPNTPHQSPRAKRGVKNITPSKLLRSRSNSKVANTTPTYAPREMLPDGQSNGLNLPLFAKPSPTSFLNTGDAFAMRTSEQDPSAHQIELPKADELHSTIKLCNLVALTRSVDNNFDLMSLVGMSNLSLKEFMRSGAATSDLNDSHRPFVKQLLECGEGITVLGYASRTAEVVTFEVPSRSQIVVVFRGNNDQQLKAVKKSKKQCTVEEFHPDQKVDVYSEFKEAYFELESVFSAMVDKLTDANPFAQVVLCGHSFGGALATMAGVRYACNRPMMRVSTYVFGSPRVGAENFRQLANSLSNLRIIRVEMKNDPTVDAPADGTTKWYHAGHSISVGKGIMVMAYRFDHNKPKLSNGLFRKNDKDSNAYCLALEACMTKKQWFVAFSGEDVGDGVKGNDDEGRHIS